MKYLSVCSGIEAATVAWHTIGFEPVGFSEIEAFPSAVLQHHYPHVPNHGDMTKYKDWNYERGTIDILVGGTPCQSFSLAGLRKGLDDPRGNLMLTFGAIANHYKPRWIVWENVPGVLSSNGGRDFGAFLKVLEECGYGFAYRVLDAQHFGVPQRRRRVFVVGCLGDWRRAAAVLFEREILRGDFTPCRKEREKTAGNTGDIVAEYFENHGTDSRVTGPHSIATTVTARYGTGGNNTPIVMHPFDMLAFSVYGDGKTSPTCKARDYKDATDLVCYGIPGNWIGLKPENGGNATEPMHDVAPCQTRSDVHCVGYKNIVRRLTPVECERLQGFPDNYTKIPCRKKDAEHCPDSPRYKALGNSMAVPVMHWIGKRIKMVENWK